MKTMLEQDLITGVRFMGVFSLLLLSFLLSVVNHGRVQSRVFNISRWLLVCGTLLLVVHNSIQFVGHFREENACLSWAINLMFFGPTAVCYNLGEGNLLRSNRNMKYYYLTCAGFLSVIALLFVIGYFTDTLIDIENPWRTTTCLIACVYTLMLVAMILRQQNEMREVNILMTDEELQSRHKALRYTGKCMRAIYVCSIATPWVGMSSSLLANSVLGIVAFVLFSWYLGSFLMYGQSMVEVIRLEDELFEAEVKESEKKQAESSDNVAESSATTVLAVGQEELTRITDLVSAWLEKEEYLNPSLNLALALKQMGIPLSSLNFYLNTIVKVDGYRQWIASLRIEASKRLMLKHPTYTIETIAFMCGFSDRSNFTRSFKAHEGVAPSHWQEKNKKG